MLAHDRRDFLQRGLGLGADRITVETEVDAVDVGLAGLLQGLFECRRTRPETAGIAGTTAAGTDTIRQGAARVRPAPAPTAAGRWQRHRATMRDLDHLQHITVATVRHALAFEAGHRERTVFACNRAGLGQLRQPSA